MKRMLPVITAVLVVLLCIAAFLLSGAVRELAELKDEVARLKVEKESTRPKQRSPESARPATAAAALLPGATPPATEKNAAANDMLMGAGGKEIAARGAARITFLRDRLNLRPEQVAALETAAASRNAEVLAAFERIRNNKARPPDMGVVMDWSLGRFPLPVKPLLDAEQAENFAGFESEERAGRIEGFVNIEMLELQSQGALHLTPEQKDQVFAALSGVIAGDDAQGDAYYADDGQFMARMDDSLNRRREALRAIFDASQFENYDRVLSEDLVQIREMFGGTPPAK